MKSWAGRVTLYPNVAPSRSIVGRKSGKQVAIIATSSTVIGSRRREPHDEEAHRDPVIHVGRDHSPAARAPALDDQIVAFDRAVDARGR